MIKNNPLKKSKHSKNLFPYSFSHSFFFYEKPNISYKQKGFSVDVLNKETCFERASNSQGDPVTINLHEKFDNTRKNKPHIFSYIDANILFFFSALSFSKHINQKG